MLVEYIKKNTKATYVCIYDWETKMALQETTRTSLQCKKNGMVDK